ncbi:sigma-70 family RNA polymerase sigma factor [Mangrovivirga sp. M17]|uniref:Sigma-70 family RNA polymerase sigma factor n=1 Tax=Mangrovivirga halotolerans TaxID=2993936 RepID=A0ABT3RR28_9BACT|nr:sigma-70 family RNA polymerase sigma factor [Mangrovivirga halotolerans]MCX2744230.1 sigma-70 family RNA polymerase sigma factor [Mangrovivirga halotolerans]
MNSIQKGRVVGAELTLEVYKYRNVLESIAYKMVGSLEDAQDIVQDAFLKWFTIDKSKIDNAKAYLVRIVTNKCLNHLESLKHKKTEYFDNLQQAEWVQKIKDSDILKFDLDTEVSSALNYLQHKLEPVEKAVFLMREVFNFEYEEIQEVIDKKVDNCRKLFSRASNKLKEKSDYSEPKSISNYSHLTDSFKNACSGNSSAFLADLRKDIEAKFRKK